MNKPMDQQVKNTDFTITKSPERLRIYKCDEQDLISSIFNDQVLSETFLATFP